MDRSKIAGCLYGMAIGDATAAITEFMDIPAIEKRFPPGIPIEPIGNPARVTDDTQMALAVGEALLASPRPFTPDTFGENLRQAFVDWMNSPDNTRAPGLTCMKACKGLAAGLPWYQATGLGSKGCGANMRVQPIGLIGVGPETRSKLAQFQAAYTHGHPTALAAADLTAFVIAYLGYGGPLDMLLQNCREYISTQREVYHSDWLGDELWQQLHAHDLTGPDYIARGWDECLTALSRVEQSLPIADINRDPCEYTGAGWIAEEAFATALFCFMLFPDEPEKGIVRATVSSGDSDSIACIAGAFAGAYHGVDAWRQEWIERIEYKDRIETLIDGLWRI